MSEFENEAPATCRFCGADIEPDADGVCGCEPEEAAEAWNVVEGATVQLPDGSKVVVENVAADDAGLYFTCQQDGATVFYYASDVPDVAPV